MRQLAQQLLSANEIKPGDHLLPLSGLKAAEELQQGRIDAAFIIAAENAPVVQVLLRSPGVKVMSFAQAEAYQRRFPFLTKLTLPQGVADLVRDYPPHDVTVLAPTANLIVRDDLHPALQSLLLQAATEVHGRAGFFQRAGEFPAYKDRLLPLSPEAARYFKSGPPFLQRYLPFWLAVLVDRPDRSADSDLRVDDSAAQGGAGDLYLARALQGLSLLWRTEISRGGPATNASIAAKLPEYRSRLDVLDDEAEGPARFRWPSPIWSTPCANTLTWCGRATARIWRHRT